MPEEFFLPFVKKEQVAKDAFAFYFDRSKQAFDFIAGQYIRITLPHQNPDERGITRLFSIVSPPYDKQNLIITTRIIQSSFKKTLYNVTPDTQVKFFGPMGVFVLKEEEHNPRVFLAGGIGITPFHSMLLYANEKKLQFPITFFASFSTPEDVIFQQELESIAKQNPNIKVIYTVSHPENSSWQGEKGRISEELIKKYVQNMSEPTYYIAGPPAMVLAMEELVKGMGVAQEQIKKEQFVGY